MNPPEFFVIMTTLIGGMGLGIFMIHRVTELIRVKMERKNAALLPDVDLLMKQNNELTQWRIKAEKRLQVLEEIVADDGERERLTEYREPFLNRSVKQEDLPSGTVPNQLRDRS